MGTDLTIACIVQAGVIPIDTLAVISELQQTWNRPDAMEFAKFYADNPMPHYRLLIENYDKAQAVQKAKKWVWPRLPPKACYGYSLLDT